MRLAEDRFWQKRFWEKVDRSGECWLWLGTRDRGYDYGRFRLGKRKERAHRVSWKLAFGEIPDGLWVLHHCDTPACVRPEHLFLGTNAINQKDATRKGRHDHLRDPDHSRGGGRARGEANGSARLTEDQVKEIRESSVPQRILGQRYGVSQVAIHKIRTRKTWGHVV